jgi:hypothetical protein
MIRALETSEYLVTTLVKMVGRENCDAGKLKSDQDARDDHFTVTEQGMGAD